MRQAIFWQWRSQSAMKPSSRRFLSYTDLWRRRGKIKNIVTDILPWTPEARPVFSSSLVSY
jgi:hypothetical protein